MSLILSGALIADLTSTHADSILTDSLNLYKSDTQVIQAKHQECSYQKDLIDQRLKMYFGDTVKSQLDCSAF